MPQHSKIPEFPLGGMDTVEDAWAQAILLVTLNI